MKMKKRVIWLSVLALILVAGISIPGTLAYFTTHTQAQGGQQIHLGATSTITEEFSDWTKTIAMTNTGANDCYIRAKVFYGSSVEVNVAPENDGAWTQNGDYWYYSDIVPMGETTTNLLAKIQVPESMQDDFDVIVVFECAAVQYDATGNPIAPAEADWTKVIDVSDENGEGAE